MLKSRCFSQILILLLLLVQASCGTASSMRSPSDVKDFPFSPPLDIPLVVQTGDSILVSGKAIVVKTLLMSEGISSFMPGSFGVPFYFAIEKTNLVQKFDRGKHKYFCAPSHMRSAYFPGFGSVVARDDCVGVRVDAGSGRKEWVVDNSQYNEMTTVWSRSVKKSDGITFTEGQERQHGAGTTLKVVIFDGYYSGILHFTLIEYDGNRETQKEFRFDALVDGPNTVGIRGNIFEVLDVSGTEMKFQWKRIRD